MIPKRTATLVLCAVLLAATCRQSPAAGAPDGNESLRATGVRSLDGDSIYVTLADGNRAEVRLIGIDAPEKSMPHANDARTSLRKLVAGKPLRMTAGAQPEDQYGRRLAWVTVDGISVSAAMLERGFAAAYVIPPNTRWTDELLAAQRKAFEARRGIWSVRDMEEPRSFRYRTRNEGRGTRDPLEYANHVIVGDARDRNRKAHWPGCIHIRSIPGDARRLFESLREAQEAGFKMERESR